MSATLVLAAALLGASALAATGRIRRAAISARAGSPILAEPENPAATNRALISRGFGPQGHGMTPGARHVRMEEN